MKITPAQQNKVNFGNAQQKFSKEVLEAMSQATKEVFDEFVPKVAKKAQKEMSPAYNKLTDGIAVGIGKLANTNTSKKIVNGLNYFAKPSARMADLASIAITFFYVNNTRKSKKIEQERKMPLMINNVAVTVVSSTMAATIDKVSDVFLDKVKTDVCIKNGVKVLNKVIEKVPEVAQQGDDQLKELGKAILKSDDFRHGLKDYTKCVEKAKSLTIFSFVVRFLVTVLMVPVAGKIVEIVKKNFNTTPDKTQQKEQKPEENKTQKQ